MKNNSNGGNDERRIEGAEVEHVEERASERNKDIELRTTRAFTITLSDLKLALQMGKLASSSGMPRTNVTVD